MVLNKVEIIMPKIFASIVLYKHSYTELKATLDSLFATSSIEKLFWLITMPVIGLQRFNIQKLSMKNLQELWFWLWT